MSSFVEVIIHTDRPWESVNREIREGVWEDTWLATRQDISNPASGPVKIETWGILFLLSHHRVRRQLYNQIWLYRTSNG